MRFVFGMALLLSPAGMAAQDTALVQGSIYQRPFIAELGRTSIG